MPIVEKVHWGKGRKRAFLDWIQHELWQTEGDRAPLVGKWRKELIQWRARTIGAGVTDVPFVGASNLEVGLTAMQLSPIYADFMQALHTAPGFWNIQGKRPDTVGTAKAHEQYLNAVERTHIKMREVDKHTIFDMILHGTGFYKDLINTEVKTVRDYSRTGNGQIEKVVKTKFGPLVDHVSLQNLWVPAYSSDIDPDAAGGAPWVAQRFEWTKGRFIAASEGGLLFPAFEREAVNTVLSFLTDLREDELQEEERKEDQYEPFRNPKIEMFEVWARFDVDGNGIEEDVVVMYHKPTGTMLRAMHNPFLHGKRPFHAAPYFPGPGRIYGVGLGEMSEWAQRASSRLLNSGLDSAFLSNAIMLGVPRGSDFDPEEPLYPGRILYKNEGERIDSINLGTPNPSIFSYLNQVIQLAEQRSSSSELRQGNITSLPSRTPAATTAAVLAEGKRQTDMILGNLRNNLSSIGLRVMQHLVQVSKDDPRWVQFAQQVLGDEAEIQAVTATLNGPVHDVEDGFGFAINTTSGLLNREAEKQDVVSLTQLMTSIYPQMLSYAQAVAQQTQDPSMLVATTTAAFNGLKELQTRLLEAHGIQNPDLYVPTALEEGQSPDQGAGPPAPGAVPEGSPVPDPDLLAQLLGIG